MNGLEGYSHQRRRLPGRGSTFERQTPARGFGPGIPGSKAARPNRCLWAAELMAWGGKSQQKLLSILSAAIFLCMGTLRTLKLSANKEVDG